MHHVIIAAHDGRQLQQVLDYMRTVGVTRVIFPGSEYRAGKRNDRASQYETVRLPPRDDDGGYAEAFLERRNAALFLSRLTHDS